MPKYRKKSVPAWGAPLQAVWQKASVPVLAALYFLLVCLSSSSTVKPAALFLLVLAAGATAVFFPRLRDRLHLPVLALALVVLMDGLSNLYAVSGKFALYEFLKVFNAFCLMLTLLAFTGEERPERKISVILEGFAAVAGLTSIDLLSTRWVSGAVLGALGWFTPDYMELGAVEEGVRMTSMFTNPNVFAGCVGLGTLLSLGLVVSSAGRERTVHLICLYINALSFLLAFSMGASGMIALAFLAYLLLERPERRAQLLLLMVETLVLSVAAAFLISLTSFTAWTGFRPVPLLCVIAGAALLCLLDRLCRPLADKLSSHSRTVLVLTGVILAGVAVFALAAYNLTGSAALQPGQSLRRAAYPEPGAYALTAEAEGDLTVYIESQNQQETMMHTSTPLYQGPLAGASFTVPEDSLVVYFNFTAASEARLDSAVCTGEAGTCGVPLGYKLLPGFIANRLQGLWANQNAIQRFVFFSDGMKLFGRSPVIGLGLGAFENGVKSVQSFYYETKYAHNHYIQTLAETGLVGLALFLVLLAVSAVCLWRGRKRPLAPALGAALVFMACHALVEFTFSIYCYLPMAFGVFAAVTLCCGDAAQAPGWLEKRGVKNGIVLGICVLMAVFMVLLGCNITAQNMVAADAGLESLERAARLDPFEKADHMLSYVVQATGAEADGTVREKADGYAARLERIESNIIPYYLAAYYLDTGRVEQGLEQAQRYVRYVAASGETWERTFRLLEEYEQDTAQYRAGVAEIAALLEEWNGRNLGRIELDGQAQAFVERMAG